MRSADEIVRSSQKGYGATLTSATIFLLLRDRHGSAAALGAGRRFPGASVGRAGPKRCSGSERAALPPLGPSFSCGHPKACIGWLWEDH